MTNKALSQTEVADVLKHGTVVQSMDEAAQASRWPNNRDMLLLAAAVKKKYPVVVFTDGARFDIRYKTAYKDPAVFVRPTKANQFVPCGYFSIRKLEEFVVESELGVAE